MKKFYGKSSSVHAIQNNNNFLFGIWQFFNIFPDTESLQISMVISYTPMLWIGTVQEGILKYQMARLPQLQVDFKPCKLLLPLKQQLCITGTLFHTNGNCPDSNTGKVLT